MSTRSLKLFLKKLSACHETKQFKVVPLRVYFFYIADNSVKTITIAIKHP